MTDETIIGKAGTGAMLALDAVGKQDTYLTGRDESFYRFKNIKHTQFTKYSASVEVTSDGSQNWPFNQTVNILMRPRSMGDLLSNMYFKCTLPPLSNGRYCDDVGYALFYELKIALDDVIIETIKCDWSVLKYALYYTEEEKQEMKKLINVDPVQGGELYVPLNFFFSRTHTTTFTANPIMRENYFKPHFLTCAAYNHRNLIVTATFNPISFFSNAITTTNITLSNVYLVTDEVILSDKERQFIMNNKQENVLSVVRNDAQVPISVGQSPFYANLTAGVPVKIMHWFIRQKKYEDTSNLYYYNNRFNFCNIDYEDIIAPITTVFLQDPVLYETAHPIISQTSLYLNGVEIMGTSNQPTGNDTAPDGSFFYKFGQALTSDLSTPLRNIYTYSFCLRPKDPQPSGALNFALMDPNTTRLTCSIYANQTPPPDGWNLHIYYVGYNQITYSKGLVSLGFIG